MYEQYEHHGTLVWVNSQLKGKHREHCLCHKCANFKPGKDDNCPLAQELFKYCKRNNMVTPVYECPLFDLAEQEKK